jgi:protease-4
MQKYFKEIMHTIQKYPFRTIVSILVLVIIIFFAFHKKHVHSSDTLTLPAIPTIQGSDSISYIPITGEIVSEYALDGTATTTTTTDTDSVLSALQTADTNTSIKAIVLVIDSTGGAAESAEEIEGAIGTLHKPIYAIIRSEGDSAAYWIASKTDKIFAFHTSDVGSIGVTESYISNARQDIQNGLDYEVLSSGIYKDAGSPDKTLTPDERALFMRDVMFDYNVFVGDVAKNRHMAIGQVKALADGSTVTGDSALKDGLIDSTGGWNELYAELASSTGADINRYEGN